MALSYEQRVLAWVRQVLLVNDPQVGQGDRRVTIDDVRLEQKQASDQEVIILFREVRRPQCIFGFRAVAHEPTPQFMSDGRLGDVNDPEGWAAVIYANFRERIEALDMGLPEQCSEQGITWVDGLKNN
jgi:hypothetical protein